MQIFQQKNGFGNLAKKGFGNLANCASMLQLFHLLLLLLSLLLQGIEGQDRQIRKIFFFRLCANLTKFAKWVLKLLLVLFAIFAFGFLGIALLTWIRSQIIHLFYSKLRFAVVVIPFKLTSFLGLNLWDWYRLPSLEGKQQLKNTFLGIYLMVYK